MSDSAHHGEANEALRSRAPSLPGARTSVAGGWLAVGSLLFIASLALHPPPSPIADEFMMTIANDPLRWIAAHWIAAMALSSFVIAGLVALTAESRLAQNGWTTSAWAVLVVGAVWVTTTAVAEATVITAAATAGDTATFEAWQLYAEGRAVGFGFLALAVAVIAGDEALSARSMTPTWAAWIGATAGTVAVVGFVVLGLWLGLAVGGPIWLGSTIVMSLWTFWFGVALTRSGDLLSTTDVKTESMG